MPTNSQALSGGTTPNGHAIEVIGTEVSYNTNANTSQVSIVARLRHTSGSPGSFGTSGTWGVARAGQANANSGTLSYDFTNNLFGYKTLGSATITVPHNSDGTGSVSVAAAISSPHLGNGTATVTVPLTSIPRASTATFSPSNSLTAGSAVTINTNRASTAFTHKITYEFGPTQSGTIATAATTSVSWTPPMSMLNAIPNGPTAAGVITTTTYNGSTQIGSPTTTGYTLTAPASVVPTISTLTKSDTNTSVSSIVGTYVQGLSTLKVDVPASGVYSSTIKSRTFSVGGGTSINSGGSTPLTSSGTVQIAARATDSRGRTGTRNENITVLAYGNPTFTKVLVRRSNASGTVMDNGTSLRVDLTAAVSSLMNSTQRNTMQIKVFTRALGTTSWTARNTINHTTVSYNSNFVVSGGANYPIDASFDVRVDVIDKFNTSSAQTVVATAAVFMHWSKTGVGIGKYHENGQLDVGGDIFQNGNKVLDVTNVATATARGIVELATNAEAQAGTDTSRAVTPAALASRTATETRTGLVERATQAEVNAGTDTTRYVSPKGLRDSTNLPWAVATGVVANTLLDGYTTVTYPSGRFSAAPVVITGGGEQVNVGVSRVISRTSTSFQVGVWSGGTTKVAGSNVTWIAIQMTSSSGNG